MMRTTTQMITEEVVSDMPGQVWGAATATLRSSRSNVNPSTTTRPSHLHPGGEILGAINLLRHLPGG